MLDSSTAILHFIEGKTRKHLNTDRMFSNAILRELEILGEAANHISKPTQKSFPELPWKQLISMRNIPKLSEESKFCQGGGANFYAWSE